MARYLVVANQTLGGEPLAETVRSLLDQGPCSFHVVVPATPSSEHALWTEGGAEALARRRLEEGLDRLHSLGCEATGEVGDARPLDAVRDVLHRDRFDAVIVSTLPRGMSRWLRQDLPRRIGRAFGLPVTHVEAVAATAR